MKKLRIFTWCLLIFLALCSGGWFAGKSYIQKFIAENPNLQIEEINISKGFPFYWGGEAKNIVIQADDTKIHANKLFLSINPWMLFKLKLWGDDTIYFSMNDRPLKFKLDVDSIEYQFNLVFNKYNHIKIKDGKLTSFERTLAFANDLDFSIDFSDFDDRRQMNITLSTYKFFVNEDALPDRKWRQLFKEPIQAKLNCRLYLKKHSNGKKLFDEIDIESFVFNNKDIAFMSNGKFKVNEQRYLEGKLTLMGIKLKKFVEKLEESKFISSVQKASLIFAIDTLKKENGHQIPIQAKNKRIYVGPLAVYKLSPLY